MQNETKIFNFEPRITVFDYYDQLEIHAPNDIILELSQIFMTEPYFIIKYDMCRIRFQYIKTVFKIDRKEVVSKITDITKELISEKYNIPVDDINVENGLSK